ncbi:hypothetical protein DICPUDRAFT_98974 [Dictyostelium purpureum]|uniref:Rho-GAP domain-containing protein n=1 Tax=Dictyostelium purpureum TaxID=5786 RepID=F0ZVA0_DICPU|nr:uncharacterized protein DICPUDRAFT_98974 [Dictyostelium purpureum]EGC32139.1 hypothetical protein DICPUDRAFT_98974 [Dictyostelium purpureum]|eukprot:XP_003291348.1 hypothetical protein DICPUDRAFT_98974 [Dictyostelium purpureum]
MHNQSLNTNNNKFLYIFGLITLIYIATTSYIMIETEKKEQEEKLKLEQQQKEREKEKQVKIEEKEQKEEKKEFNKPKQMNSKEDVEFKDENNSDNQEVINNENHDTEENGEEGGESEECDQEENGIEEDEEEYEGEEESIEQFSMFGVSIEKLMEFQQQEDAENGEDIDEQDESNRVPIVLSFMLDRIKNLNGFETEGLFRVNGNLKLVEQLATEGFDPFSDDLDTNVHTWASLLKKWIRDLPEPIIPSELNQTIMEICNNKNFNINSCNSSISSSNSCEIEKIEETIRSILEMVKPDEHKFVLYRIGLFFGEMLQDENVQKTKITIENLSKIITPSLFKPIDLENGSGNNQLPKFASALDFSNIMSKQKKEIEFVQLLLIYFKYEYFRNLQLEKEFKNSNINDEEIGDQEEEEEDEEDQKE